jgi:hypothetical protein
MFQLHLFLATGAKRRIERRTEELDPSERSMMGSA